MEISFGFIVDVSMSDVGVFCLGIAHHIHVVTTPSRVLYTLYIVSTKRFDSIMRAFVGEQ